MAKVRIKLNRKGVRELLKCPEIQAAVKETTQRVLDNAGGFNAGYSSNQMIGKNRAIGRVYCLNAKARIDNQKNNTLLKAIR